MVLQTQRCPGTAAPHHPTAIYQQQNYLTYQETSGRIQDGGYTNFSATTGLTNPYSNYSQVSNYPSENSQHNQSGGAYFGSGANQYCGGGVVATGLNESSYHGNSHSHGNSFSHGHNSYGNGPSYSTRNSLGLSRILMTEWTFNNYRLYGSVCSQ